jgi:kinesin family protein 3/17
MTGCACHSENGLISNAIEHVFNLVQHHQSNNEHEQEFTIKCAYLESNVEFCCLGNMNRILVYNEELHDLLLPRTSSKSYSRLELRENPRSSGVHITNLTWKNVYSIDECLKFKRLGDLARTMGSTQMNRDSSRSHTMFSLSIQYQHDNQTNIFRQGKLNFVDLGNSSFLSKDYFNKSLAGSERQIKTGASGQQLLESAKINLSLSALNKVISSLVHTNTTHIPYRDSKLTRLLQDSIGGTTKTIMIACISPSEDNYDETLCTLR